MSTKVAEVVRDALSRGYQMHPEAFAILEKYAEEVDVVKLVAQVIEQKELSSDRERIITRSDLEVLLPRELELGEAEVEEMEEVEPQIEVVKDPTVKISPAKGPEEYEKLFRSRLAKLLHIVSERPDSYQIRKISSAVKSGGECKVAGLVMDKRVRRSYTELTIDDETGRLSLLVRDESLRKTAAEVSLDQLVIVDVSFTSRGLAVVKGVYPPDIPDHTPSFSGKNVYMILTSDMHVGSRMFRVEEFRRFLRWLKQNVEDEYVVKRVQYVVLGGDLVDGVGVYPDQEGDLDEADIYKQYLKVAQLLKEIPRRIKIFIIPGNHDPARQALPQPAIPRSYAASFYEMENVVMLGNPAQLKLHNVNVLTYHGRSLDDIVATIPGLTFSKPTSAMKILLKARHLAPMYGGRTQIAPDVEDHLVIEDVPDVFHTGHVHSIDADNYRGTLMVNSGTWQDQTRFQADMGVKPSPSLLPIVNLSTLQVTIKDFRRALWMEEAKHS